MMQDRLLKLRQKLIEQEVGAIIISQPQNRRYLSGFDGSAGLLLISQKHSILATDFRYTEQAKTQAPDYDIVKTVGKMRDWFPRLVKQINISRLAFEAEDTTVATLKQLENALDMSHTELKLIPLEGLVEAIRSLKDATEIEYIDRATSLSDAAFEHIRSHIKEGMTEKEVAWLIERFLRENGSQPTIFDVIVASGPNAALPHAKPSERPIKNNEPIILDFSARVEGYSSDLSRTIYLGKPDDAFNKVYNIVLSSQLKAISEITSGMNGRQADAIARKCIDEAGYGNNFGHGLGHGLGLDIHEKPTLGPSSTDILSDGMAFTIEPGIYINGWGGVRIEDTVTLDCAKIRTLSQADK
jgi:Xaa-Pro aminopeptidase